MFTNFSARHANKCVCSLSVIYCSQFYFIIVSAAAQIYNMFLCIIVIIITTRMEGKAQRVAARALSPTGDNWGVEVPVSAASHSMHGTNAIALVYAQHAHC